MTPELVKAITDAILALLGPVTTAVIGILIARPASASAAASAVNNASAAVHAATAKEAAAQVVDAQLTPVSLPLPPRAPKD